jgi:hypothetical protein
MPKKVRKDKRKAQIRNRPKSSASTAATQISQPVMVRSEQTRISQSQVKFPQEIDRHHQVKVELKRIGIIGGILLVILIVLCILFR